MREEDWVESLRKRFPFSYGVGIGDDAAVVRSVPGNRPWVITSDLLVEDVHFRLGELSPQQLALKSLAVNLSDLAAMGAKPLFYTLALVLPPDCMGAWLQQFYDGIQEGNRRWQVELAGGDFSAGAKLTVAVTAVGETERPVLRRGARPGDVVAVCGVLGWSKLGLHQLQAGLRSGPFIDAHIRVEPRLAEGLILGRCATAMMDVSDGLLKDLGRLCAASQVGAEIDADRLNLDESFVTACQSCRLSPLETALGGGEDYALLCTVRPGDLDTLHSALRNTPLTKIGRIVAADRGVKIFDRGRELRVEHDGFDHFAAAKA